MLPSIPTEFTPFASLFGGVLIGLSAVLVMAMFGRIAGIAGISIGAAGMQTSSGPNDRGWRLAFIAGLIVAPLLVGLFAAPFPQTISSNWYGMAVAGLLVGVGTRLGSGCTSGHGVCGLARLSKRSAVAVCVFMAVAILTVTLMRHGLGG